MRIGLEWRECGPSGALQLVLQTGSWSGGGAVEERAGTKSWKSLYILLKTFGVYHEEKRVEGVW